MSVEEPIPMDVAQIINMYVKGEADAASSDAAPFKGEADAAALEGGNDDDMG